ncbi:putative oxidoreductase [Povalibacter uvarum]|uniref:Putative oxidoreductase n=1 Tax=Povalibacter uvarum TaxID=732238 RepID=A0A841HV86_9GAMM|nr:DoxX family protein [Povalibacter uvarum]MBB6096100.1 putative oxidoreductase [Povalibacter uvarum]
MSNAALLTSLQRYDDHGLLLLRVLAGSFLIYGVWDNITSAERMEEFVAFLTKFGFPAPAFMARLSVWAQFLIGLSFITGLLMRWAGILCAINFAVAFVMVDRFAGFRGAFPALCLLALGVYFALRGSGRFGLDAVLERRAQAKQ